MTYTELGFGLDPDWHPTEELIVFKGCNDQGQECGLYTMGADGSARTQLSRRAERFAAALAAGWQRRSLHERGA